jgi:hypothetical protein
MNKKFLILLLIVLGLGIFYFSFKDRPRSTSIGKTSQSQSAALSINCGTNTQGFGITTFIGKTALEASQSVAQVETTGTGANAFVTSINGRTANFKKHEFWELDTNGTETQMGAGSYIIKNGDQIEWKISTF